MSLADTVNFILNEATDADLDRVVSALKDRRKALATMRAANVTTGVTATTHNLSPKYLNGLTGTVVEINGKHADLELDADSTDQLRWSRQSRFAVPADARTYRVRGIPLTCLTVASG
ncbi:hypothetical protein [Kitasatospora griseola]|uniref:hypothetical protein n=1 Tax=Kitasatospora griseola TaxID=2064 RepID=UPI00341D4292